MGRRAFVRTVGVGCAAVWLMHCSGKTPIQPTPPLTIACPASVSVRAAVGASTATATFNDPTTSGGMPPVTTACTAKSGDTFTPGSYAINCTAVDTVGHAAACTFTISVDPAPTPKLSVTSFMAFGDSLTEGKLSSAPSLVLPNAYTLKLQALLQGRYTSQTIVVTGEGVGGEMAVEGISRFDQQLASDKPGAVLLMDGANDLLNRGASGITPAIAALDTMGSHALAKGAVLFLATLPPENPQGIRGGGAPYVRDMNARIAGLAAQRGWTLVDVNAAFKNDLSLIGPDGLHLTDAGYQTVAQTFYDRIVARLELPLSVQ